MPGLISAAASALLVLSASQLDLQPSEDWRVLSSGVDYSSFLFSPKPEVGDGKLHVVRIDPIKAELVALAASLGKEKNKTAGEWCRGSGLVAVINAGMYDTDFSTHVGFFRVGEHVNSSRWNSYQSLFVFDPHEGGERAKAAQLLDRDALPQSFRIADFPVVVQNLRLIRGKERATANVTGKGTGKGTGRSTGQAAKLAGQGRNVWAENHKRWSESALAQDAGGRILFLFSRTPYSMRSFNDALLRSKLDIERAAHLEGGPEASLSICVPELSLDLAGSFETHFNESDMNAGQWPLPNIIGVKPRR